MTRQWVWLSSHVIVLLYVIVHEVTIEIIRYTEIEIPLERELKIK